MDKIDQRNRFDEEIFTYRATKQGTVLLSWHGKQVTILKGKAAQQFLAQVEGLGHLDAQLLMAKATGNTSMATSGWAKNGERTDRFYAG